MRRYASFGRENKLIFYTKRNYCFLTFVERFLRQWVRNVTKYIKIVGKDYCLPLLQNYKSALQVIKYLIL